MAMFEWFKRKQPVNMMAQIARTPQEALRWTNDVLVLGGGEMARAQASTWPALHRAVSLLSGAASNLTCDALRVIDSDRKVVKTPAANRALMLFKESPDGETPANQWIEDAVTDLAVAGNAVMCVERSPVNGGTKLILCYPNSTQIEERDGYLEFRVRPDNVYSGGEVIKMQDQVIICRGPRIGGRYANGGHPRYRFMAPPLVQTLGRAVLSAVRSEEFVAKFFDSNRGGSVKSDFAVEFDENLDEETQERVAQYLKDYLDSRAPLVLPGGGKITQLSTDPQSAELSSLRRFQVEECARIYGIPPVLLSQQESNTYGSSVYQLNRLFVQHSLRHFCERLLHPISQKILPRGQMFSIDWARAYAGDFEAVATVLPHLIPSQNNADPILSKSEIRSQMGYEEDMANDWRMPSVDE